MSNRKQQCFLIMKLKRFEWEVLFYSDYATENKYLEDDEVCGNSKGNFWVLSRTL